MSLRPDFQPRPVDDEPSMGRRDPFLEHDEMLQWDEECVELGLRGMGDFEAGQLAAWLTKVEEA